MRIKIMTMLLAFMWLISNVEALTRIVDIDGTGQYTSIQTAINASSPGDTIFVYPGSYLENVYIQTNNISLLSLEVLTNNPAYIDSTIIDGNQQGTCLRVMQQTQNVHIRGFTITNGFTQGVGGGVLVFNYTVTNIENCVIYGNKAYRGGGIGITGCTATLKGVVIKSNFAALEGGGVYIYGYSAPVNVLFNEVSRCSIYNNKSGRSQDVIVRAYNSNLCIYLNTFSVSNPSTYYATFDNGVGQNYQLFIDFLQVDHQEINSDLYVSPDGNDANDGLSPVTALKTIHTAVYRIASDSLNQKSVYILPGTYSRTTNQQSFPIALKSWVKIKGSGINNTQIVGEPDPAFTNQELKVFATYYQNNISLEDMSITTANSTNSYALDGYREDHVNLKNLRMYDLSPNDCAVIHIVYAENCLWDGVTIESFTTQRMGFLACQGEFTGVIKNSVFRNAISTYISPDVWAYPLIWISVGAYIRIENTIFSNITMMDYDSQAIAFGSASVPNFTPHYVVSNCLFVNITCNERAVLLQGNNYPVIDITNCTFAGQSGNGHSLMVNGSVTISNCIFYNDRPREIAINPMDTSGELSTITFDYNLIKGGYSGILQAPGNTINYLPSNINTDPLFAGGDLTNPLNYSLADNSPCINTGTPDTLGLNLPPYDLAGNWRIWNGRIDMGAYEYGSEPYVSNDDPVIPVPAGIAISVYPNPFQHFTNLCIDLRSSAAGKNDAIYDASISVYNIKGQRVKNISLGYPLKGEHLSYWDGRDANNIQCSSGIYFINLIVNGKSVNSRKVTLIR